MFCCIYLPGNTVEQKQKRKENSGYFMKDNNFNNFLYSFY